MKKTTIVTSFFRPQNTKEEDLVTVADASLTYHGVRAYFKEDLHNLAIGQLTMQPLNILHYTF